ncbi:MAG TPA: hypothetical protein VK422_12750 [Pyrinomonadaceae bacterium]|nr:hypothetical protein [Pyrinomonadaceae bacterium]
MKKIIGPVLFALNLLGAVALTVFLTAPPTPAPPPAPVPMLTVDEPPPAPAFFKPRFVTLDFATRRSHVTLELERDTPGPPPESVWVWAYFFRPGAGYYCSGEPVQVWRPFATGNRVTVTVRSEFQSCAAPTLSTTFYARVNVSTDSAFAARLSEPRISYDITQATPVVVQGAGR